jgi:hypothetical protein
MLSQEPIRAKKGRLLALLWGTCWVLDINLQTKSKQAWADFPQMTPPLTTFT